MILLTSTVRKLEAVLGDATTTEWPMIVHYVDVRAQTQQTGFGCKITNTNDTTTVEICSAPISGVTRVIRSISIWNADTTAHAITIKLDDDGTDYTIFKATLSAGDQAYYEDRGGWKVLDSTGALK